MTSSGEKAVWKIIVPSFPMSFSAAEDQDLDPHARGSVARIGNEVTSKEFSVCV